MHTHSSRREFYTQAAANNLRLIEEITSHLKRTEALFTKLIGATSDLVAILATEIGEDREADRERDQ